MNNPFDEYLDLLNQICGELAHLTELMNYKTAAVRSADLNALDQVMKQEQAASLTFRGLEQKRAFLLNTTGLNGIPLSSISNNFPPKMRLEAKQVVERLQDQYKIYTTASEVARNTLECNLHEIEKILASADAVAAGGPGYQPQPSEPPASMKTDLRA